MQVENSESQVRPWYKEPFVWMLIGLPATTVVMGVFFISLAVDTKDTLVRDNYYKDGLAINQELAWDKKAKSMEIRGTLTFDKDVARFEMEHSTQSAPNIIQLHLSHPTLAEKDSDILLQMQAGSKNTYIGQTEALANERYYLSMESPEQEWRIRKDIRITQGQALPLP